MSFVAIALLFALSPARAQNVGALQGTVIDPDNKAVSGAKVTITDLNTHSSRSMNTDDSGAFSFTQLNPSNYKIEISRDGFKSFVLASVTVLVDNPTSVPVKLEVGATSQTVIVESASAPTLNTEDATVGNAVEEKEVKELPFLARNVVNLLTLQPGVVFTGRSNMDLLSMGSTSGLDARDGVVNGIRSNQTNVTLDGVDDNDWQNQAAFTSALPVTLDSVQEFRVTTTNSNATEGDVGGAQVVLQTKSGTNEFHGNIRWYYRTTGTSADTFFNNAQTPAITRPKLVRNIGGGSIGGRIIRNRAYFFIDNEERRDRLGATQQPTVATANLRDGVLIYQCAATATQTAAQVCPGGSVQGMSGTSYAIPVGDFGLSPANIKTVDPAGIGINPTMTTYMKLFPAGNAPSLGLDGGLDFTGLRFNAPEGTSSDDYTARLDYKITSNGNHSIFWRGSLINLSDVLTPAQFPGQSAASELLNNSKGMAVQYEGIFSPNLINTVRYGYTRLGVSQSGTQGSSFDVRSFSDVVNFGSRASGRIVPVHDINDDLTWTRGKHSLQFGGVVNLINNSRLSESASFPAFDINNGFCQQLCAVPLTAAGFPDAFSSTDVSRAFMMLTGSITEVDATVFGVPSAGAVQPVGTPDTRDFKEQYYSVYAQDSWHVRSNIVLTYGLRWGYETPVYETNGFQVSPTVNIMQWFLNREINMANGLPSSDSPTLSWGLAGKANGKSSWYAPDYKDFQPRFAVAYSPGFDHGIGKAILGGPGNSSIRVGAGFYDDRVGQPIAVDSDLNGSPGTATSLTDNSQQFSLATAPRFAGSCSLSTGCTGLPAAGPPFFTPPTSVSFPFTPAVGPSSLLGFAVDPNLRTPYSMHFTLDVQRQLPHKFLLDVGYVGTLGRRLLGKADFAQYLDLTDPASGMDLFTAYQKIAAIANIAPPGGISRAAISPLPQPGNSLAQLSVIQDIPYFNHLLPNMPAFTAAEFKNAAYASLTPTQAFYAFTVRDSQQSWSCALFALDPAGRGSAPSPWSSSLDPTGNGFVLFQPQFQSLPGWTNWGNSNYHSLQVSVRKNVGIATFAANYVFSKAIDNTSTSQSADINGGGTLAGLIQNPFNLRASRGLADFNLTHNFNGYYVVDLPFGHGRKWVSSLNRWEDAIVGGWELAGSVRWLCCFPISPSNGFNFPTNFELTTPGTLTAPVTEQLTRNGAIDKGVPNIFANPTATIANFAFTLPGLAGSRNTLRDPAFADTDMSLNKTFRITERQGLQFRATAYNLFNSVNFSPPSLDPTSANTFGTIQSIVGPRGGADGVRQMEFAVRYSF